MQHIRPCYIVDHGESLCLKLCWCYFISKRNERQKKNRKNLKKGKNVRVIPLSQDFLNIENLYMMSIFPLKKLVTFIT